MQTHITPHMRTNRHHTYHVPSYKARIQLTNQMSYFKCKSINFSCLTVDLIKQESCLHTTETGLSAYCYEHLHLQDMWVLDHPLIIIILVIREFIEDFS